MKNLLYNRGVLYSLCVISIVSLVWLHEKKRNGLSILMVSFIVGLITTFFTKNMIVVLSVAILCTWIIHYFDIVTMEAMTVAPTKVSEQSSLWSSFSWLLPTNKGEVNERNAAAKTGIDHDDDDDGMPGIHPSPDHQEKLKKEEEEEEEAKKKKDSFIDPLSQKLTKHNRILT